MAAGAKDSRPRADGSTPNTNIQMHINIINKSPERKQQWRGAGSSQRRAKDIIPSHISLFSLTPGTPYYHHPRFAISLSTQRPRVPHSLPPLFLLLFPSPHSPLQQFNLLSLIPFSPLSHKNNIWGLILPISLLTQRPCILPLNPPTSLSFLPPFTSTTFPPPPLIQLSFLSKINRRGDKSLLAGHYSRCGVA